MKQHFTEDSNTVDDDEKIVLDKATFRALASDTRINLLKELDVRRKTLTELAHEVGLAVATVKEHMEQLVQSKLVKLKDEGRKWKYYELTEKGKAVLYPERKKIWVMLASLAFMIVLSFYMSQQDVGYFSYTFSPEQPSRMMMVPEAESIADIAAVATSEQDTSAMNSKDAPPERMKIAVDENSETEKSAMLEPPSAEETRIDIEYQDVIPRPYLRYIAYAVTLGLAITMAFVIAQHALHRKKMHHKKHSK